MLLNTPKRCPKCKTRMIQVDLNGGSPELVFSKISLLRIRDGKVFIRCRNRQCKSEVEVPIVGQVMMSYSDRGALLVTIP